MRPDNYIRQTLHFIPRKLILRRMTPCCVACRKVRQDHASDRTCQEQRTRKGQVKRFALHVHVQKDSARQRN